MAKPRHGCGNRKRLKKGPRASTTKTKALDVCCLDHNPSTENRCPSREQNSRTPCKNVPKEDPCKVNPSIWGEFPVCLRFAVLGILLIVLFVYITVEKKPLFG